MIVRGVSLILAVVLSLSSVASAQKLVIPRRHDRPPGPPLGAHEAAAKMTVPDGFTVEVVAAEPDVVNPVAMFIDEKGRFWITESFEYPRHEPGPGRDRIKVLEDTDADGKIDKVTIFAEGLNIPSGIAVGHGGVWVANSPDLLFLQDTDGDLKADNTETLLTGFGRTDTHELPNSFTWGPDGWLYGLNGVFNDCHVRYGKDNPNFKADHPGWKFTCALFRIHPRTKEFQVFCEGTSNPWGIAINDRGDFFVSACVIDHLWHLTERAYYIRQGGPYPPNTWPLRSIVNHNHQKAAYCGITWFDSDAYPPEYRNTLYMGNIHGNCINADVIEPKGASYAGKPHPGFAPKPDAWKNDQYGVIRKTGDEKNPKLADLLQANDQWFMPVVQKTGPDGCLYILDWYDQYHCYQDANADPEGIDRGKGRLYRLRYRETPRAKPFDLAKKSDDELIEFLRDSNVFYRETAQRLLAERDTADIQQKLLRRALAGLANPRDPYRELFALASLSRPVPQTSLLKMSQHEDPVVASWAYRIAGNAVHGVATSDALQTAAMLGSIFGENAHPRLAIQSMLAIDKSVLPDPAKVTQLCEKINCFPEDPLVLHVGWQLLHPVITRDAAGVVKVLRDHPNMRMTLPQEILTRLVEQLARESKLERRELATFLMTVGDSGDKGRLAAARGLEVLTERIQARSISGAELRKLAEAHRELVVYSLGGSADHPLWHAAANFSVSAGEKGATTVLKTALASLSAGDDGRRIQALRSLLFAGDAEALTLAHGWLARGGRLAEQTLFALSRSDSPGVAKVVLAAWADLPEGMRPKAIDLLCERPAWSSQLVDAIEQKQIAATMLNLNQVRRILGFKNEALRQRIQAVYGAVRETRSPDRDRVISNTRNLLDTVPGDPHAGYAVFKKVCAQCHKIYGEGVEVGPDITANGRNNWDQLLSNVLDPSLVIGKGYQARILATADGRVLTGLPVEETEQQVVLKVQGGKLETIPRSEIEQDKTSELSMMPEQLEKQLSAQELADLFAFLALDKPPGDASAKVLSGAPKQKPRS
jgi:putative membrane-bound dehydrogenase-like protein